VVGIGETLVVFGGAAVYFRGAGVERGDVFPFGGDGLDDCGEEEDGGGEGGEDEGLHGV